jgi:hypothetical protein
VGVPIKLAMRLTPLRRAAGAVLARDIPAPVPGRLPVLRSGAVLTEGYREALRALGINAVWIEDDLSEGIEPHELVPPHLREEAARTVSGALTEAREGLARGRGLSPASAAGLKRVVRRLSESVAESPPAALVLADLAAADAYTHQHSIDVCALGLLVGRRLFERRGWEDFRGRRRRDDIETRLLKLGLGLLLHDVGKLAVPAAILAKTGPLTPAEREIVEAHPDAGAELLGSAKFSPLVRAIVREHHERWDGEGYPRGLRGTQINELSPSRRAVPGRQRGHAGRRHARRRGRRRARRAGPSAGPAPPHRRGLRRGTRGVGRLIGSVAPSGRAMGSAKAVQAPAVVAIGNPPRAAHTRPRGGFFQHHGHRNR